MITGRIIAIDVDSVLFPVNDLAVLPALHAAGFEVTKEDITAFDYAACLGREAKRIAFEQFARTDLYDGHETPYQVDTVLEQLRAYNRVIAVSSPFAQHASSKWSYCLRAGFEHDEIVLCGDKLLVDFDVLVDDRPETLLRLGNRRAVVFDQPWNRGVQGIPRARGWHEVLPAIEEVLDGHVAHCAGDVALVEHPGASYCTHGRSLQARCDACGATSL